MLKDFVTKLSALTISSRLRETYASKYAKSHLETGAPVSYSGDKFSFRGFLLTAELYSMPSL